MIQTIAVMLGGNKNKFKPYPRPGNKKDINKEKIGKDAVPVDDLHKWIKERQHG